MTPTTVCAESVPFARLATELHLGRGWLSAERALVRKANRNDANGYYKALGLTPDASREQIKAAYRRLAMKLHPDHGGDEDLFSFISQIAHVLLNSEKKNDYDSVDRDSVYLGIIEREELARNGFLLRDNEEEELPQELYEEHWGCLTNRGHKPGECTDAWIDLCWQVSPAVGYRGKVRVGVIEGGRHWPCSPDYQWGILTAAGDTFAVFQTGVEPNRLHALCAMIELQKQNQRAAAQDRESTT